MEIEEKTGPLEEKVAVCLQIYHTDLWGEFRSLLEPLSHRIRLYVALYEGEKSLEGLENFDHQISLHGNYGADVAPFLHQLTLVREPLFIKIHSKKSRLGANNHVNWRRVLLHDLLGSEDIFLSNIRAILSDRRNAMLCNPSFLLKEQEMKNSRKIEQICGIVGLDYRSCRGASFLAGNMFMGRTDVFGEALVPRVADLDSLLRTERGKVDDGEDGTYSHSMERIFGYLLKDRDLNFCHPEHKTIKVMNDKAPNGRNFSLVRMYDGHCYMNENPYIYGVYRQEGEGRAIVEWLHLGHKKRQKYLFLDEETMEKVREEEPQLEMPSDFEPEVYRSLNIDLKHMGDEDLRRHYSEHGQKEGRQYRYAKSFDYVPRGLTPDAIRPQVRVIAHYFPQYHVIPENEEWWGKDFTDWVNVRKARPLFCGHYQPHVPDDFLGHYDLTDAETQGRQVALAKEYGVYGFCFYAYWFGGRRLLERPLQNYLNNRGLDLPFCICWANENWTRRWDGLDDEVLISQSHSEEDDLNFIEAMAPYMRDPRYIRVEGKALLAVYRPSLIPDMAKTSEAWRNWCRRNGVGELYLVHPQTFRTESPSEYGFDASYEFPPVNHNFSGAAGEGQDIEGGIWDIQSLSSNVERRGHVCFKGIMPSWDNSPRRKSNMGVFVNASPKTFESAAQMAFMETLREREGDERIVFVNAWNEWAEGCHLEPDRRYGYAWLQAIKNAHRSAERAVSDADGVKERCRASLKARRHRDIPEPNELAVACHGFHIEHLREIMDFAAGATEIHDAWFFVTSPPDRIDQCRDIARESGAPFRFVFLECENMGRDILPFFKSFDLMNALGVRIICKVHSKKSVHRNDGESWRRRLLSGLFDPRSIRHVLRSLYNDTGTGIMLPESYIYHLAPNRYNSQRNMESVRRMAEIMGVETSDGQHVFPAGSMFWARTEAIMPMHEILDIKSGRHFPAESGQLDETFAHCCERLFSISAESVGLDTVDSADPTLFWADKYSGIPWK